MGELVANDHEAQEAREVAAKTAERSRAAKLQEQRMLIGLMLVGGLSSGVIAWGYNTTMEALLDWIWADVPSVFLSGLDESLAWVYIPLMATALGALAGLAIRYLGEPGDLPDVVMNVHLRGYVPMSQTPSMICCSLASIVAGGSLGPEAPLVAISSSAMGWLAMRWELSNKLVRRATLIGASAGLSAFFGVTLGGALFALEVCHSMGLQWADVAVYCVGAGTICLVVFRGLSGMDFGEIWDFPDLPDKAEWSDVVMGVSLGALAVLVGLFFTLLHRRIGDLLEVSGLGNMHTTRRPVLLAASGGLVIGILGALLPPTMFWSEFELKSLADIGRPLEHVWPSGGVFYGYEAFPYATPSMFLLVGIVKLVAISVTVHAGFRGGFIFPLMFAGANFGSALAGICGGFLPSATAALCMAAGLNVVITRTPFATSLILTTLSGLPHAAAPILGASLTALFLTHWFKFIGSQKDREDCIDLEDGTAPSTSPNYTILANLTAKKLEATDRAEEDAGEMQADVKEWTMIPGFFRRVSHGLEDIVSGQPRSAPLRESGGSRGNLPGTYGALEEEMKEEARPHRMNV